MNKATIALIILMIAVAGLAIALLIRLANFMMGF